MNSLWRFWQVIRHFLCSNSRHGTHSPFVYRLAAGCIYNRSGAYAGQHGQRWTLLLEEIAAFFEVKLTDSNERSGEAFVASVDEVSVAELVGLQQRFKFVALYNLYLHRSNRDKWLEIVADPRFIVTIDLFYFGIVFYRTEQSKENFVLRFPYWKYFRAKKLHSD